MEEGGGNLDIEVVVVALGAVGGGDLAGGDGEVAFGVESGVVAIADDLLDAVGARGETEGDRVFCAEVGEVGLSRGLLELFDQQGLPAEGFAGHPWGWNLAGVRGASLRCLCHRCFAV